MSGTKNFSLNKKNNRLLKFLIGAAALFVLLAVINLFSSGLRNNFYAFSSPIQKVFWTAGESSSGFLASFINVGSFNKENQNLKNQVQQLQAQIASLQAVISGNQAQSNVSLACQNNGFELLMAGVIGLDNQDMLSINKGSSDGVEENMPVINQQGAVFGKIFKVYKNFSKVMLISNKDSVINVKVRQDLEDVVTTKPAASAQGSVEPREIDGVIRGKGGLKVYLDLVPIDDTINQGDILLTSALEGTFPKDLLIGSITNVQKNDQNPHQQAQVEPFLSSSMDNLFVILNYKR